MSGPGKGTTAKARYGGAPSRTAMKRRRKLLIEALGRYERHREEREAMLLRRDRRRLGNAKDP